MSRFAARREELQLQRKEWTRSHMWAGCGVSLSASAGFRQVMLIIYSRDFACSHPVLRGCIVKEKRGLIHLRLLIWAARLLQKEKRKMTRSEAKQDVKCFQTRACSSALFKTWIQLTNFISSKLGAAVLFVKGVRKLQTLGMKHLRSPEAYLVAARFPPTQKEPPPPPCARTLLPAPEPYSATRSF